MEILKNLMQRIKWRNVLAVLILLAVIILLLKSIPGGYRVKDNIGLKASANPDKIGIGERSRIEVEVKNMYPQAETSVVLTALTHDGNLIFLESGNQTYRSDEIKIGPSETRKVGFTVETKKYALAGNYRIDVSVKEDGKAEPAEDTIFLNVEKS